MKQPLSPFAQQSRQFLMHIFVSFVKTVVLLLVLGTGVLVLAQSSVAPVSVRMLTSYGLEYAAAKCEPYRHWFPKPYVVQYKIQTD